MHFRFRCYRTPTFRATRRLAAPAWRSFLLSAIREHPYGPPSLGAVRLLGHHAPAEAADNADRSGLRARHGRPETGIYELLTMMGSPAGTREHIESGAPLPPAPRGWTWRLVRQGLAVGYAD
jgi:hypothetical protein